MPPLRRKDHVDIGKLAGLIEAEAGLQQVRPPKGDGLAIQRFDVGARVGRKADADRQSAEQRFAQLHPERRLVRDCRLQVERHDDAVEESGFLQCLLELEHQGPIERGARLERVEALDQRRIMALQAFDPRQPDAISGSAVDFDSQHRRGALGVDFGA